MLLLVAVGAASYGGTWLVLGDTLRTRDVTVVGAQVTDPTSISRAADVAGHSLLTIDTELAAEKVATLPGIREARVQRDWPHGVIIDITEHEGWGYWQIGGVRRVIDIDGNVLVHSRQPRNGAPTIVEFGPPINASDETVTDPNTVRLVDRLVTEQVFDLLRVKPIGFVFSEDRGLTVLIQDSPHAVFGDSYNYEFKIASWGALLDRIEQRKINVREIDLRFGSQLVLR